MRCSRELEVKLLEKDDLRIKLLFKNAPTHVLAALRRAVMQEVPTMAVDTLFILENNSVLYDEILAHRIAMIPLTSEKALEKYKPPEQCVESGEGCTTRLYLEVKNEDLDELTVYSRDLKPEDPDVKPVYDNIPIVILGKGQSIVAEAEARLGRGREHIKWSPASVSVLLSVPLIRYDTTRASQEELEKCLKCISEYSEELAEKIREKKVGEEKLVFFRTTSLLKYCEQSACRNIIKVEYLDNERILLVESTGSLKPETIVRRALVELDRKLVELGEELEKISGK